MLAWLRTAGMVRRDAAPEPDLLPELFRSAAPRFACPQCNAVGLSVGQPVEEDDEDWGMARKCESCHRPIARERLEVFPDTRLCVECQSATDRGDEPSDVEYCPRCGSIMTLRQSRRGLTRYVMSCPACRS
jgi:DNA-directed RNA polymerase subunit M/transcription elongation factor TFIIS